VAEDCLPRVIEIVEKHRRSDHAAMSAAGLLDALRRQARPSG
jgi:hypothetical protein